MKTKIIINIKIKVYSDVCDVIKKIKNTMLTEKNKKYHKYDDHCF